MYLVRLASMSSISNGGPKISGSEWPKSTQLELALSGLNKTRERKPKQAPAIGWNSVRALILVVSRRRDWETAAAYGLSSSFLFRSIDECIPLEWDGLESGGHSQITFASSRLGRRSVIVDLRSSKNARFGARLERACPATGSAPCNDVLCPYHLLLALFRKSGGKGRLFRLNATQFARQLKEDLRTIGVEDSHLFTPHGFRRGSAQEMHSRGASLAAILVAGGWRSSAFLTYLQQEKIDCDKLMQCLCDEDEA